MELEYSKAQRYLRKRKSQRQNISFFLLFTARQREINWFRVGLSFVIYAKIAASVIRVARDAIHVARETRRDW